MKDFLLNLKRQAVLYKEIAQMVLNHAKPEEIMPWLNILSTVTMYDYSLYWDVFILPARADELWRDMRRDILRDVKRICFRTDKFVSAMHSENICDADVLAFAELCSELGHLSVYLETPQLDEQLADMASRQIPLFVSADDRISPQALSILLASVMQFKGMGSVELKEKDNTDIHLN